MAKFTVGDVTYDMVTADKVTFAEGRAIEKVTGQTYAKLSGSDASLDFMQALLWVSMKRHNPDVTFDDLDDLEIDVDIAGDEDPTAGDEAPAEEPTSPTSD